MRCAQLQVRGVLWSTPATQKVLTVTAMAAFLCIELRHILAIHSIWKTLLIAAVQARVCPQSLAVAMAPWARWPSAAAWLLASLLLGLRVGSTSADNTTATALDSWKGPCARIVAEQLSGTLWLVLAQA